MTTEIRALYTRLPAIDRLLRDPAFSSLLAQHGHSQVVTQLRQMLDEAREQIRQCQTLPDWSHDWLHACEQRLHRGQRSALRPVFNLTGNGIAYQSGARHPGGVGRGGGCQRDARAGDARI
ncbi:L-seryl-tRNA(Sec) selenium transferase [Klebsiella pneumoniae]|uniref:L-seryl-tRNA(Sec) selenium transferase n=1 Tax=Klebsiella pneumoniae TaxID=573 RepID=A0A378AY63_KLEPN|nr:L-seryl-tRNA(Sec) selenium transferase [Klebsiella pneumoniae]